MTTRLGPPPSGSQSPWVLPGKSGDGREEDEGSGHLSDSPTGGWIQSPT